MFDQLLTNACVATMDGEASIGLIDHGAIGVVEGRISWVGPMDALPSQEAGAIRDLDGKVVTPGLVSFATSALIAYRKKAKPSMPLRRASSAFGCSVNPATIAMFALTLWPSGTHSSDLMIE